MLSPFPQFPLPGMQLPTGPAAPPAGFTSPGMFPAAPEMPGGWAAGINPGTLGTPEPTPGGWAAGIAPGAFGAIPGASLPTTPAPPTTAGLATNAPTPGPKPLGWHYLGQENTIKPQRPTPSIFDSQSAQRSMGNIRGGPSSQLDNIATPIAPQTRLAPTTMNLGVGPSSSLGGGVSQAQPLDSISRVPPPPQPAPAPPVVAPAVRTRTPFLSDIHAKERIVPMPEQYGLRRY